MAKEKQDVSTKQKWAYAYELVPPQAEDLLHPIRSVLDREHDEAKLGARTWASSLVVENQVTHILVVSDSPEQNLEINFALEAKLKELNTSFSLTAPMRVAAEPAHGNGNANSP